MSSEIVCGSEPVPTELWEWAKKYLLKMEKRQKFGNLYEKSIAAAKRCADDLAGDLEKEYDAWKKEMSLR